MSLKRGKITLIPHGDSSFFTSRIFVLTGESLYLLMDVLLRIDDISILGKFPSLHQLAI